ncbi:hypothetical protein BpHYR1_046276 [Brachionus plicatilis]|uniref:Uncharacterized protein n=1 Tax=Brachionus plicatilis TaxID=10195 RepID=A0A3M7PXJ3_BRAPC|nr:hypothetical protein BpHYR1_046276 [Brachionus plicatilis]
MGICGITLEAALNSYLRSYRSTPYASTGITPANLLLRASNTARPLDVMHSTGQHNLIREHERQNYRLSQDKNQIAYPPDVCWFKCIKKSYHEKWTNCFDVCGITSTNREFYHQNLSQMLVENQVFRENHTSEGTESELDSGDDDNEDQIYPSPKR